MNEPTDARTNQRMHKRMNARTNEYTGLHPVLVYFAPSGLGGSIDNPDSLTMNACIRGYP
ncbi:MAG: hypothetical protein FJZ75_06615 [Bacteroidetes bacterium]|nr:hypothetical protein [Bacteroidota bacterium]